MTRTALLGVVLLVGAARTGAFVPAARVKCAAAVLAARATGGDTELEQMKATLLQSVAFATAGDLSPSESARATADVVLQIEAIEARNPTPDPVDSALLPGSWSLIFTTGSGRAAAGADSSLQAAAFSGVYELLYRNSRWSWLAGGLHRSRADDGAAGAASSRQIIDVAGGSILNVVDLKLGPTPAKIVVNGAAAPTPSRRDRLEVVFESTELQVGSLLPPLTIPLPRPRGFVDTTFLDETMRISRGSRSTIFLTVRSKQSRAEREQ